MKRPDVIRKVKRKTARLVPPIKDSVTVPWMDEREIPAIKLILSRWRKLRKCDDWKSKISEHKYEDPTAELCIQTGIAAYACEVLTSINQASKPEKEKKQ